MDSFAPEFAQVWLSSQPGGAGEAKAMHDDDASAQKAALEELAERVTLARSIS